VDFGASVVLISYSQEANIRQEEWEGVLSDAIQADVPRSRLEHEYVAAFLPYGLVPGLLPRGQDVGDIIARLDGNFIARGDECFPGLVPREADSTLTAVDVSWNAAAELALGVEAVVAAEAKGHLENRVQVRFEQVRSRSASLTQLRERLKAGVVPGVEKLLAANWVEFEAAPDWLLIGEVLTAVTVVRVTRSRAAGGKADLSFLQRIFGTGAQAKVGGDLAKDETAEIRTTEPLPVAFRPARVKVTAEIAGEFRGLFDDDEAQRKALGVWVAAALPPIGKDVPGGKGQTQPAQDRANRARTSQ
jgi:hypothetical protein